MELVAGRNFSPSHAKDSTTSYIINESAVEAIGWTPEEALGKGFRNGQVIGVVKNFQTIRNALRLQVTGWPTSYKNEHDDGTHPGNKSPLERFFCGRYKHLYHSIKAA